MPPAIEVVIREPRLKRADLVSRITVGIAVTFLNAWFLMLMVPIAFDITIGYWQAAAIILCARFVLGGGGFIKLRAHETQKVGK